MRSGASILFGAALVVLLGGCSLATPPSAPSPGAPTFSRAELEPVAAGMVAQINLDRDRIGLGPLVTSAALTDIAFSRSKDMIVRSYFGHADRSDAMPQVWPMLSASGYAGRLGENLYEYRGALTDVAAAAVGAWMASRDHRKLLLDDRFHFTGVGLMGDSIVWRVTQVFAESGP